MESTGSSSLPPKKPASVQQSKKSAGTANNASTQANANSPAKAAQPAEKKSSSEKSAAKDPSLFSPEATKGIEALTSVQVQQGSGRAEILKTINQALRDPSKSLSDTTFSGLLNAAKNYSKNSTKFDPSGPGIIDQEPWEESGEEVTPKLAEAIRRAFG